MDVEKIVCSLQKELKDCVQKKKSVEENVECVFHHLKSLEKTLEILLVCTMGISKQTISHSKSQDQTPAKIRRLSEQEFEKGNVTLNICEVMEHCNQLLSKFGKGLLESLKSKDFLLISSVFIVFGRLLNTQHHLQLKQNSFPYYSKLFPELVNILEMCETAEYIELLSLYEQAITFFKNNNFKESISILENIISSCFLKIGNGKFNGFKEIETFPLLYVIANYLKGFILFVMMDYSSSRICFQTCLENSYRILDSRLFQAICFFYEDKHNSCIELLEEISSVALKQEAYYILYNISVFYSLTERYSFSLEILQGLSKTIKSIKIQFPDDSTIVNFQQNQLEVSKNDLAYEIASTALLAGNDLEACRAFMRIFSNRKVPKQIGDNDIVLFRQYCYVLLQCNQYDECISTCNSLLSVKLDIYGLLYKSDALQENGDILEAKETIELAIEHIKKGLIIEDDIKAQIISNYALLLIQLGDEAKSFEILEKEIRTIESNTLLLYNYTLLCLKLGNITIACATWLRHVSISLSEKKEYYTKLLEEKMFSYQIESVDTSEKRNSPSLYQTELLTKVCLRFWSSRSNSQFSKTSKLLKSFS